MERSKRKPSNVPPDSGWEPRFFICFFPGVGQEMQDYVVRSLRDHFGKNRLVVVQGYLPLAAIFQKGGDDRMQKSVGDFDLVVPVFHDEWLAKLERENGIPNRSAALDNPLGAITEIIDTGICVLPVLLRKTARRKSQIGNVLEADNCSGWMEIRLRRSQVEDTQALIRELERQAAHLTTIHTHHDRFSDVWDRGEWLAARRILEEMPSTRHMPVPRVVQRSFRKLPLFDRLLRTTSALEQLRFNLALEELAGVPDADGPPNLPASKAIARIGLRVADAITSGKRRELSSLATEFAGIIETSGFPLSALPGASQVRRLLDSGDRIIDAIWDRLKSPSGYNESEKLTILASLQNRFDQHAVFAGLTGTDARDAVKGLRGKDMRVPSFIRSLLGSDRMRRLVIRDGSLPRILRMEEHENLLARSAQTITVQISPPDSDPENEKSKAYFYIELKSGEVSEQLPGLFHFIQEEVFKLLIDVGAKLDILLSERPFEVSKYIAKGYGLKSTQIDKSKSEKRSERIYSPSLRTVFKEQVYTQHRTNLDEGELDRKETTSSELPTEVHAEDEPPTLPDQLLFELLQYFRTLLFILSALFPRRLSNAYALQILGQSIADPRHLPSLFQWLLGPSTSWQTFAEVGLTTLILQDDTRDTGISVIQRDDGRPTGFGRRHGHSSARDIGGTKPDTVYRPRGVGPQARDPARGGQPFGGGGGEYRSGHGGDHSSGPQDGALRRLLAWRRRRWPDRIHFTITGPSHVIQPSVFVIDVWVHQKGQRNQVLERARTRANNGQPVVVATDAKSRWVHRGTRLSVWLDAEDLLIDVPERDIVWNGAIGNASFSVRVPELKPSGEPVAQGDKEVVAQVSLNGLVISELRVVIRVADTVAEPGTIRMDERRHQKAFASYAREDKNRVEPCFNLLKNYAPDLQIFWDQHLLPGDPVETVIFQKVAESTIFYLFWSRFAQRSFWVRREWKYALRLNKSRGGRPVLKLFPLVSPKEVPLPVELSDFHFGNSVFSCDEREVS